MKKCPNPNCNQSLGETIIICPACGHRLESGPDQIDNYRLLETIRESSDSICFRAQEHQTGREVMLRLYPETTSFLPEESERIHRELLEVGSLSADRMIQHVALQMSADGRWYRVSEWIETVGWGDLAASRFFRDPRNKSKWIYLFIETAEAIRILHASGRIMPHLSLNDLLLHKDAAGHLRVKLDYKLSPIPRNLIQIPGELKHLAQHPDLAAGRPLDHRSDIWTLGRLMVELLIGTDEFDDCQKVVDDIFHRYEPIVLHRKLSGLLRSMVEDDPEKRASSINIVLEALRGITDKDIARWDRFAKDPTRKKKLGRTVRLYAAAATCITFVLVGTLFWYQQGQTDLKMQHLSDEALQRAEASLSEMKASMQGERNQLDAAIENQLSKMLVSLEGKLPEQRRTMLTEKYRRSVAFILVSYHLEVNGEYIPVGGGTGTAFLVSADGDLLTNRHVACPWLDNQQIYDVFENARQRNINVQFGYDLYVWFDGDEAFRTVAGIGSQNVEDSYRLSTAYRRDGINGKTVEIVAVMPEPDDLLDLIGGLQDDVAVLRVSPPPVEAIPIPLRTYEKGQSIPKGTSVFALGFPHGKQSIMGTKAISRCTDGTISRVFENVYSTNADLHPGNSGGPVIDLDGFAIGIASALFVSDTETHVPQIQNSMGRILPIQKARLLLDSVRMGNPQWKGMPTYAFEGNLERARQAALSGRQQEAVAIIDDLILRSADPGLYFWAGVLSSKGGVLTDQGKAYLNKALRMDPHDHYAKFLLYRADFLAGVNVGERAFRKDLKALDWRSSQELFGFLVRMIEGDYPIGKAVATAETPAEETFIHWVAACGEKIRNNPSGYAKHLQAAYAAAETNSALSFIIQAEMREAGVNPGVATSIESKMENAMSLSEVLNLLMAQQDAYPKEKTKTHRTALISEVFKSVSEGQWGKALMHSEKYLAMPCRESANVLGVGLLRCQILYFLGNKEKSTAALNTYIKHIRDPWYRKIGACLLGEISTDQLKQESRESRKKALTLSTAMGLKAEAENDLAAAVEYYNDALDTGLMNWMEFELAGARREMLRQGNLF